MSAAVGRWIKAMQQLVIPAKSSSRPSPSMMDFKHLGSGAKRVYLRNFSRWERFSEKEEELKLLGLWDEAAESSVWDWYDSQRKKEKAAP